MVPQISRVKLKLILFYLTDAVTGLLNLVIALMDFSLFLIG